MILNLSKIKTEALLLFCKDLITTYKDSSEKIFDIDEKVDKYINSISEDILKQINNVTFDSEHYLKNRNHYRIKAVLNAYNFINKEISKYLSKNSTFNPAMLYLALLAVWFKELDKERDSKEFIYFTIFPYANMYDKLLLEVKDEEFKKVNIAMMNIAETTIVNLDRVSLK
ncbi:hypothetical protein [Malaciobacter marinus]|uniref:Uncharacterized protein n=1 Tax=Malaciobacter marinus TaxID=505249 RepID=A0A347THF1_9BACT|nr:MULTISPECIES: hypothetical protein [Malaciobacter]AXX86029.1 hypothetical protein AMRN_0249 [Malaciobacter marinus]PHO12589.1 hypothetical protein CPG38_07015 [Malaciobacter marinus]PHO14564.1 hypothetical protein CPH92_11215 [Malaciobacter marinus]RYA23198.1 hypothetical protein CRU96_08965 [Malaciobacter halophilus]